MRLPLTTISCALASSGTVAGQPGLQGHTLPAAAAAGTTNGAQVLREQQSSTELGTPQDDFVQLLHEQHSSTELGLPQDQFDELLQGIRGMSQTSIEDWLAHLDDPEYKSKISAAEQVLNTDAAARFSKVLSEGCADDPMWRDVDGDGCEIYKFLIESGRYTREAACSGGGNLTPDRSKPLVPRGLRGAYVEVVADATAMVFCPATCGMCNPTLVGSLSTGQRGRLLQMARPQA